MGDLDAGAIEARIMSVRLEPLRPTSAVGVSPLAIHPAGVLEPVSFRYRVRSFRAR